MAYTNIELVRKHLQESTGATAKVENYHLVLTAQDIARLPHAGVVTDSETVKGKHLQLPEHKSVTFDPNQAVISQNPLIPDSVVVSSDSSLSDILEENSDYTIDLAGGRLTRLEDGTIASGATVFVWYYNYETYVRGIDYDISYQSGEVRRIEGGAIASNQSVWIDYLIEGSSITDSTIESAIRESSTRLDALTDGNSAGQSVSVLTVAETYLAVSLLSQMKAIEMLQSPSLSVSQRGPVADEFLEVSKRYREDFEKLVKPFIKQSSSLSGPSISRGRSAS
jgi:hypothetical protein